MKDEFSARAPGYARFRPGYPEELIQYVMGFVQQKELAWDCGTGNGQCAKLLSRYFDKVFATDISQKQLDNAHRANNIVYALEPAESTGLAPGSVDLITVAQAIHWFDLDHFYTEVRRVAKPGAVIAVWSYSLLRVCTEIDRIIGDYHHNTLAGFWDAGRKQVDEGYANLYFPFREMETKPFNIEVHWRPEDLEGYLNTWSALRNFMAEKCDDPVPALMEKIKVTWGGDEVRPVKFPVHLRLGIIE